MNATNFKQARHELAAALVDEPTFRKSRPVVQAAHDLAAAEGKLRAAVAEAMSEGDA